MAAASRVLYAGDGVQTQFTVTFPFISPTHVKVFLNNALQLDPMHYTLSGSQVTFGTAPDVTDAISIQRNTSPSNTLVDFINGSVLNESDLDTAYLHNFYLGQEYADSFNATINAALIAVATGAGIVETETDEVIAALVNEMINSAAADDLLDAVSDIDLNAESVLEVQTDVSLMGVSNGDDTAFIFNSQTVKIDSDGGDTFSTRLAAISATGVTNAALVATEEAARITADSAEATARAVLQVEVDDNEASIVINASAIGTTEDDVTSLEVRYGVTLAVNGYVSGFVQNNDGQTGTFVVLADKFGIVTPTLLWAASTAYSLDDMIRPTSPTSPSRVFKCTTAGTSGGSEPTWDTGIGNSTNDNSAVWETFDDGILQPFLIDGNKVIFNADVEINGSLMVNGTIIGAALVNGTIGTTQIGPNAITTDQLNANAVTAGKILANAVTAGKINVTDLAAINADLGAITAGEITLNSAGHIKSGKSTFPDTGDGFWLGYDGSGKFHVGNATDFMKWDGTSLIVRGNISIGNYTASDTLMLSADTERSESNEFGPFVEYKKFEINRPGTVRVTWDHKMATILPDIVDSGQTRVLLDGVVKTTRTTSSSSYAAQTYDLTVGETSQFITIELASGTVDAGEPVASATFIRNARIKADKSDGEVVITD